MYYYFGRAVLLFVCLWWCKVVIFRIPSDIREFKESDYSGKIPVVVIWLLTVCIIIGLVVYTIKFIATWGRYF